METPNIIIPKCDANAANFVMPAQLILSCQRKLASSFSQKHWIPAFAGMTKYHYRKFKKI